MSTYEQIRKLVMQPDAPEDGKLIFTPKEVREATGISVGALNNRAFRMGIKRKGYYTVEEVVQILSTPLKVCRIYDPDYVEVLRAKLLDLLGTTRKIDADRQQLLRNGGMYGGE